MKTFVHLEKNPELIFGMMTENINGKRNYVTPSGKLYPSITTVLSELSKDSIQKWRKRVGETEANKVSGKAGGNQKLLDLGLTQAEATALTGYTPPVAE